MRPIGPWISVGVCALLGCSSAPKPPEGRPLKTVYQEARTSPERVELAGQIQISTDDQALGSPRPYVPVLAPPEVFSVYVLPHINEDGHVSVQGHWVHIKLSAGHWWHQDHQEQPNFNLESLGAPPHRREQPQPLEQPTPQPRLEDVEGTKR